MVKQALRTGAVLVWLLGALLLGGVLLIRHLVALPVPAPTDRALVAAVRAVLPDHTWGAVHVMYRECPCSQRTITHLLATARPAGVRELVIVVDDHAKGAAEDDRLRRAGFAVEVVDPATLASRFHIEAAPVLIVVAPDGGVAYLGGYNRHKQSAAYEDLAIIAEARAAQPPPALPVFGCATSARLARALDPLHLARTP